MSYHASIPVSPQDTATTQDRQTGRTDRQRQTDKQITYISQVEIVHKTQIFLLPFGMSYHASIPFSPQDAAATKDRETDRIGQADIDR